MDPAQAAFVDLLLARNREAQEYAEEMKRIAQEMYHVAMNPSLTTKMMESELDKYMIEIPIIFPWEQRAMRELQEEMDAEAADKD